MEGRREKKSRQNTQNVLFIGSGGREHALSWKLAQSEKVRKVFVAPGNGGTGTDKSGKIENLEVNTNDAHAVLKVCEAQDIALVVVGPEAPLAQGLADVLRSRGYPCFGPNKNAALIESSKAFAKEFMFRHHIPTARYKTFTDAESALKHVASVDYPIVIKASGLAAGKGVILPSSVEESKSTIQDMMEKKVFGEAGQEIVIEERLEGEEVSVLAFTDGYTVIPMPPARDHKRIRTGDEGPNTGGMGAYCPAPVATPEIQEEILKKVLQPTVDGLRREGRPFVGCLYAGLMLTKNKGIQVLEFNCRFGDPETQAILALLSESSDLYDIMLAASNRCLDSVEVKFTSQSAATVVLASEGYPDSYPKGLEIKGTDQAAALTSTYVFHAGTETKDGKLVTSGGRVLAVTGVGDDLHEALEKAYNGVKKIEFKGMQYRTDIGHTGINLSTEQKSLYATSGVDIDAGNKAVQLMKQAVASTYGPQVLAGIGAFGGLFDASILKEMKNPVLVGSTDGVGTKIMVASKLEKYDTVGQCLVNHCVNDILVQGGKPLFFLDYFATSKLNPEMVASFVTGCAIACKQVGCALLGGETAEMPGVYRDGEFDVAGCIVGVVDKSDIIDGSSIEVGDVILGLESTGLHTNGYSLARRALEGYDFKKPMVELGGKSIGEALLAVHRPYIQEYDALIKAGVKINGLVHVTGGGFIDNPPRILPKKVSCNFIKGSWPYPAIFQLIQQGGKVSDEEMARVFNIGIGMLVFVKASQKDKAINALSATCKTYHVGNVISRDEAKGKEVIFSGKRTFGRPLRLAVLGSTRGTDLQYILDQIKEKKLFATVEIVISDKKGAYILERAKQAGVPTKWISALGKKREEYDAQVHRVLQRYGVDLVLLIGYMRIVSGYFVNQWPNKIMNVHPSLLPAFAGGMDLKVHEAVIKAGAKETGCTVHYVDEGVDTGKILVQKATAVTPEDTPDTLKAKVQALEGVAFVEAIELFASGSI